MVSEMYASPLSYGSPDGLVAVVSVCTSLVTVTPYIQIPSRVWIVQASAAAVVLRDHTCG